MYVCINIDDEILETALLILLSCRIKYHAVSISWQEMRLDVAPSKTHSNKNNIFMTKLEDNAYKRTTVFL